MQIMHNAPRHKIKKTGETYQIKEQKLKNKRFLGSSVTFLLRRGKKEMYVDSSCKNKWINS